jgi:hypothetical protein
LWAFTAAAFSLAAITVRPTARRPSTWWSAEAGAARLSVTVFLARPARAPVGLPLATIVVATRRRPFRIPFTLPLAGTPLPIPRRPAASAIVPRAAIASFAALPLWTRTTRTLRIPGTL